ncbi:GFA family protein [Rhizosaccharibacter radicis]|uniref:GFA family protein n=1 Tax=Rhizosaccharibacter radicis TaxID=2782605 RepID=A0ABT1VXJ9_9PROT|nr:GFA family protein [Acetobacteraceae bacterium KSS12]
MHLDGSCHCGAVRFSLRSSEPVPYQRCYCSICRKTQGGGGYAINLGGDARSLRVEGREHVRLYHAVMRDGAAEHRSEAGRAFCGECGSGLWLFDPRWPELIHPFASAIDTPLPNAPANVHLMLGSRPAWVPVEGRRGDDRFDGYPELSLADWHREHGVSAPD